MMKIIHQLDALLKNVKNKGMPWFRQGKKEEKCKQSNVLADFKRRYKK